MRILARRLIRYECAHGLPRSGAALGLLVCCACGGATSLGKYRDTDGGSPDSGTPIAVGGEGANGATSGVGGRGSGGAPAGGTTPDAASAAGGVSSGGTAGAGGVATVACDLFAQAGCASGEKCTWRYSAGKDLVACAHEGTVPTGGDCTFDAIGDNDCIGGATCTVTGLGDADPGALPRHTVCRDACASDADCATPGTLCLGFAASCSGRASCGAGVPGGFCVPVCTPFTAGCGPNGTCAEAAADVDGMTTFFICRFQGTGAPGSPCTAAIDCGSDMTCTRTDLSGPTCIQFCDGASHGCPIGMTCSLGGGRFGECL